MILWKKRLDLRKGSGHLPASFSVMSPSFQVGVASAEIALRRNAYFNSVVVFLLA